MPTGTTYVDYTVTNASVLTYYFTFPILDVDHIVVVKNGTTMVQGTNYTVNQSAGSITFLTAIAVSDSIRISRVTERDAALVTFVDGATTPASDLNKSFLQNFYISQETDDVGGLSLDKNADGNYEANNIRIVNVGTPVANGDAITKSYVDQAISNALFYNTSSGYLVSWSFTGNGSQLAYTLTSASPLLNDARNFLVTVSGVLQPFSAYTVTSNVLTFVTGNAPPNLAPIFIIAIGFAHDSIGTAVSAGKWSTARTLSLSGDVTGSVSLDGSANASISAALATVNTANPSTQYTNANIKVDNKGRVTEVSAGTSATNFTAATSSTAGTAGIVPAPAAGQQYATLRGDASWVIPTIFSGIKEWKTAGTYTWTVPNGVNSVHIFGTGGAGGGAVSLGNPLAGFGACGMGVFPVVAGTTITVTVGITGISSNSAGSQTNGTASSFGSYFIFGGGFSSNNGAANGSISGTAVLTGTYATEISRPSANGKYVNGGSGPKAGMIISGPKYGVPYQDDFFLADVGNYQTTLQGYIRIMW